MPAAFPILTVICRDARTDVFAGAMSVSCVTTWPSARTETQEFSDARMTSVKVVGALSEDLAVDLSNLRTVTSPDSIVSPTGVEVVAGAGCGVETGCAAGEETAACAGDTLFEETDARFVAGRAGAGSVDDATGVGAA